MKKRRKDEAVNEHVNDDDDDASANELRSSGTPTRRGSRRDGQHRGRSFFDKIAFSV
jgi:hypothetical protein